MAHRHTVVGFFDAIAAGRLPDELVTDDLEVWTPTYGNADRARFAGGVAALAALFTGDLVYDIDRVVEEGDRVAAEVRSHGTFRDGEPYAQTHMFAFEFAGERIARVAEHMNTLVTMEKIVPRMRALMANR